MAALPPDGSTTLKAAMSASAVASNRRGVAIRGAHSDHDLDIRKATNTECVASELPHIVVLVDDDGFVYRT